MPGSANAQTVPPAPDSKPVTTPSIKRSADNAVSSAEDAFGVSVGREQLGLYTSSDVRGFSPLAANNARIDGIYFDPVYQPNDRILASTTIRVGIAAQGSSFIAPTGVVDYALRRPSLTGASGSASIGSDAWGTALAEADIALPLVRNRLAIGLGGVIAHEEYGDGTSDFAYNAGVMLRWEPSPALTLRPFATILHLQDAYASPIYVPPDGALPSAVPRREFGGPRWADTRDKAGLSGVLADWTIATGFTVSGGVFHSYDRLAVSYALLRTPIGNGRFNQTIIVSPPQPTISNSGEVRLVRSVTSSSALIVSARFRDRTKTYGGSVVVDDRTRSFGERVIGPRPPLSFGPTARDETRQWSVGFGYEGKWRWAALNVGAMKTSYRKTSLEPGLAPVVSRASPWLLSATASVKVGTPLAAYASFAQGLEESAAAPDIAVNRGEPVPAIRTRQVDGGIRWRLRPGTTLVAGVFDLQKPYFDLDSATRYRQLGTIRNRGIEVSLTGKIKTGLNVVVGALLQDPRVTGTTAIRPTDFARRLAIANLDWTPAGQKRLSFDLSVTSTSSRTATTDGSVAIPARTLATIGSRYRFDIGTRTAVLRLLASNLTNVRGFELRGAGAYAAIDGRKISAYLTVDF